MSSRLCANYILCIYTHTRTHIHTHFHTFFEKYFRFCNVRVNRYNLLRGFAHRMPYLSRSIFHERAL